MTELSRPKIELKGYVPIAEIELRYHALKSATAQTFQDALIGRCETFAASDTEFLNFDYRLFVQIDGEYLFVNPDGWTVSIVRPFRTGQLKPVQQAPASRVNISKLDPELEPREIEIWNQIHALLDTHREDTGFIEDVEAVPHRTVFALDALDGAEIIVRKADAEAFLGEIEHPELQTPPPIIKFALKEARKHADFTEEMADEPEASKKQIPLPELEYALSLLNGKPCDQNIRAIHSALISRVLTVCDLGGRVVPAEFWPQTTDGTGSHWLVSVPRNNVIQGFNDKLIFIPRKKAIDWLETIVDRPQAPNIAPEPTPKEKIISKAQSKKLFQEFMATYQDEDWPSAPERDAWYKEVGIRRKRMRELWDECSEPHMSKSGKRPRPPRKTA